MAIVLTSMTLDEAWDEAEVECAKVMSRSGYPATPKLLGPFPMVGRPRTYQAGVWDVDGRRYDDYIGLGDSPANALMSLVIQLRRDPSVADPTDHSDHVEGD